MSPKDSDFGPDNRTQYACISNACMCDDRGGGRVYNPPNLSLAACYNKDIPFFGLNGF